MWDLLKTNAPSIWEFVKQHGAVGVFSFIVLCLSVWVIVKITNAVSGMFPSLSEWLIAHKQLANTCNTELPKIREVVENSTQAVMQSTDVVKQCNETTVAMAREGREAREGSVRRDQELKKTIDGIEVKIDSISLKIGDGK